MLFITFKLSVKSYPIKSPLGSWTELEMSGELCIGCMVTSSPKTHAHASSLHEMREVMSFFLLQTLQLEKGKNATCSL